MEGWVTFASPQPEAAPLVAILLVQGHSDGAARKRMVSEDAPSLQNLRVACHPVAREFEPALAFAI